MDEITKYAVDEYLWEIMFALFAAMTMENVDSVGSYGNENNSMPVS
jgi:hypothetical protein